MRGSERWGRLEGMSTHDGSAGSPGSPGDRALPAADPVEALDDLEAQAAAWSRDEREVEVVDRAIEAYRSVTLAARLVASLEREVDVDLGAAGRVRGRLVGAGDGWVVIDGGGTVGDVLVLAGAVVGVRGAADRAATAAAWPLASRRSLGSAILRQVAGGVPLVVTLRDGERRRGRAGRLGADFLEVIDEDGDATLLAIDAIAVMRPA